MMAMTKRGRGDPDLSSGLPPPSVWFSPSPPPVSFPVWFSPSPPSVSFLITHSKVELSSLVSFKAGFSSPMYPTQCHQQLKTRSGSYLFFNSNNLSYWVPQRELRQSGSTG